MMDKVIHLRDRIITLEREIYQLTMCEAHTRVILLHKHIDDIIDVSEILFDKQSHKDTANKTNRS